MTTKIEINMRVSHKSLYAFSVSESVNMTVPATIIAIEGEVLVEHQSCSSCRPKTTKLLKPGSYINIDKNASHRVKNNSAQMIKYATIYPEISEPE